MAEYGALTYQDPFDVSDFFFTDRGGITHSSSNASFPIRYGVGELIPIQLYALGGGGGTASWDGSPDTVTYGEVFVPEPSTLLLLGIGALGLGVRRHLAGMPGR